MAELANRILASFYGLAFGDALGDPLSSITYEEIKCNNPEGFEALDFPPDAKKFTVGDDTQTALYTALAMRNAISDGTYKKEFIRHLLFWFDDPVTNRHASQHLLSALEKHQRGLHWTSATNTSLNRCDVMARSSTIAYWMARSNEPLTYWSIAQLQAAITHAHPITLVANTLYVEALVKLLNGMKAELLINHLLSCLPKIEQHWNAALLEDLWEGPDFSKPSDFFRAGTEKCRNALERVELALIDDQKSKLDPSEIFGEGWTADEALAISLYTFLSYPNTPEFALKKAVFCNGPSDSLGAMAGALAGAYSGSDAWPSDWYSHIEYKDELLELSRIIGRGALI